MGLKNKNKNHSFSREYDFLNNIVLHSCARDYLVSSRNHSTFLLFGNRHLLPSPPNLDGSTVARLEITFPRLICNRFGTKLSQQDVRRSDSSLPGNFCKDKATWFGLPFPFSLLARKWEAGTNLEVMGEACQHTATHTKTVIWRK